eukprot:3874872-Alexandrium_andersonii.AAC.1
MSASLVGSEMCIRDRASPGAAWAPGSASAPGLPRSARSHECPAAALTPVSYTHLTLPTICSV